MLFPALLIGDHRIQVYIFHTAENMGLHIGIFLLHGADELLDLYPFGTIFLVVAGGTRVRELAGALDEMQVVVIPPRLDVILPDEVQRADQLHALKVGTVQLGHHRLDLGAVEHAHENRLDDIIVVMAQGDLIAAQLFCKIVQVAAAHSGAQITGGFLHMVHRIKNIGFENLHRNVQLLGVILDHLPDP